MRMTLRSFKNISLLRKVICMYFNILIRNVRNVHFLTYICLYESSTVSIYKGNFSSSLWLSLWPKYKDYIPLNIRNYLAHVYRNLPCKKNKNNCYSIMKNHLTYMEGNTLYMYKGNHPLSLVK
jgi:hypothetical protein